MLQHKPIYNYLIASVIGVLIIFNSGCQDDPYIEPAFIPGDSITSKSAVYITGVRLNSYPLTDPSGLVWDTINTINLPLDPLGLPDPFFNLSDFEPEPLIFWSQESHFSDVSQTDSIAYVLTNPFKIEQLNTTFSLNIYDYDVPDSTKMGFVNLFVGQYPDPLNPYPTSVLIQENGFSVIVGFQWEE